MVFALIANIFIIHVLCWCSQFIDSWTFRRIKVVVSIIFDSWRTTFMYIIGRNIEFKASKKKGVLRLTVIRSRINCRRDSNKPLDRISALSMWCGWPILFLFISANILWPTIVRLYTLTAHCAPINNVENVLLPGNIIICCCQEFLFFHSCGGKKNTGIRQSECKSARNKIFYAWKSSGFTALSETVNKIEYFTCVFNVRFDWNVKKTLSLFRSAI